MLEALNQHLLHALAAPPDLHGAALFGALLLANWAFLIGPGLLVLLWILGDHPDRQAAVGATLTALLGLAIAHVLSSNIMHSRPFMDGLARNYLNHVADSSLPSDHCTLLFSLAFCLMVARPARIPRIWIAVVGLALLVGWSRIFLGAHYPFDVVAAGAIALLSTAVLASPWGRLVVRGATAVGELVYASPPMLRQAGGDQANRSPRQPRPGTPRQ